MTADRGLTGVPIIGTVPLDSVLETPTLPPPRLEREPLQVVQQAPEIKTGRPVRVAGKRFTHGGTRFAVRGVTYGSFLPRSDGCPFPEGPAVRRDFAAIRGRGLNTVRTYAAPPVDVVDAAAEA